MRGMRGERAHLSRLCDTRGLGRLEKELEKHLSLHSYVPESCQVDDLGMGRRGGGGEWGISEAGTKILEANPTKVLHGPQTRYRRR